MPNNIAIIPARGGSKRIPRKNVRDFLGKPIIAYSIEAALQCGLFDEVMVSTENEEIAAISRKYGAVVPFVRSEKNADDYATTADVLLEVLDNYNDRFSRNFEYTCCIYPTAPFISSTSLKESFQILVDKKLDSVFPICAYSYPIFRSLQITEEGKVYMIWPENLNKRSQDMKPVYHDAGQFYWINVLPFLAEKKILTTNSGSIILNEKQIQDIDNEVDWQIAELKYSLFKSTIEL